MATSGSKQPRDLGDTPSCTKRGNTNTSTELQQQRLDGYVSSRAEPVQPPSHPSDSNDSSVGSAPTNDEDPTSPPDTESAVDAALTEFDQLAESNSADIPVPTPPPAPTPPEPPRTNDN